jgi:O-antigen/teichoic acid export membrane protein
MGKSNGFLKNSFLTLSRQLLSIIIVLVTMIIIARYLGPKGQGSYSLIILLPKILVTFLNLGIGPSSVYYIGKKEIDLNSLFKTNIVSSLVLSAAAYLIGLFVVLFFSDQLFSSISPMILLAILLILPILFMNQLLQVIFQGKEDFKSFNAILLIGQGTTLVLVAILLILLHGGLIETLLSFAVGQTVTLITIIFLLKRKLSVTFKNGEFSHIFLKKSLIYGIKTHMSNILAFVNYRADLFMISFFLNPAAVGIYVVAVNIAERLWIFSKSISSVLFPRISSLTKDEEKNRITSIISRNVLAISVVGGIIFYFSSDLIIQLLFGDAYQDSTFALKLLLPGIVVGSMSRILSNDIAGRGRPEINMYTSIFTVTTNIVLNIVFIPLYGINGAALATSITYGLNWIIKIIIYNKITGQPYKTFLVLGTTDVSLYLKLINRLKPSLRGAS